MSLRVNIRHIKNNNPIIKPSVVLLGASAMALIRLWPTHSHPSHLSSLFTHNTPSGILLEGKKEKKIVIKMENKRPFIIYTVSRIYLLSLACSPEGWVILIKPGRC